jgi:hypothetical protein
MQSQHQGTIYGGGMRTLINLPLGFSFESCPKLINVIFKVDTGSPVTTLTREVV